jgi:hypothetical protein
MRTAAVIIMILLARWVFAQSIPSTPPAADLVASAPNAQTDVLTRGPRQRHTFVAGSLLADVDELDYRPGGGAVPTGGIGISMTLGSRYDLRGEFEMPGWHRHHESAQGPPVASDDHSATRTRVLAILLGRRFGQRRHIILLLGGSLLAHDFKSSGFWMRSNAEGVVVQQTVWDERIRDYMAGLSMGVDIPFSVSQRLAIVPLVRVHRLINGDFGEVLPRGYFAGRAGVAFRVEL